MMWSLKRILKQWVFPAVIGFSSVLSATNWVQAASATDLTQASKSEADLALQELDDDSDAAESTSSSTSSIQSKSESIEKRLNAKSTVYLGFTEKTLDDGSVSEVSELIPSEKIFTLDTYGYLTLEGVGRFKLAGLTESEAEKRLSAEPLLADLSIEVSVLPLEIDEKETLSIFGSSLFETKKASTTDSGLPVPAEYMVGPGDEIIVQLYGSEDSTENLIVSREGVIELPQIGPMNVAGQTFSEMRKQLSDDIEEKLIGSKAYIAMGELRSINVMVVGEVVSPGTYEVGALSSAIDVLNMSGGISEIGSFRKIQIKRGEKQVAQLNLYDLLLSGDLNNKVRLQSGDVIFVPPAGPRVTVSGEVKRPAIYELNGSAMLNSVLDLAGGLKASAYSKRVLVDRFSNSKRSLVELDLGKASDRKFIIKDGDSITVSAVGEQVDESVRLLGHVLQPGVYAWNEGMTVSDILPAVGLIKNMPDLEYALINRRDRSARDLQIIQFNLGDALLNKKGEQDIAILPGDDVYVFGFSSKGQRQFLLSSMIAQLKKQASQKQSAKVVNIEGGVFEPGAYPLSDSMKVTDLITAAGNLKETASTHVAEITRVISENGERSYQHIKVRLDDILAGNADANLTLQSYDTLVVKSDPRWIERYTVEVSGEVRFPGVYPIARGEQLSNVIERAGGLTDLAFPEGSILSRASVKESESNEILSLADKLEVGLKATILERADESLRPNESLQVATDVISLLREVDPPGRVVIDMPRLLKESSNGKVSDADVMLMDGDSFHVPPFREVVSVIGEVNHPTTLLFSDDLSMMDYVDKSGGMTQKTKEDLVYIVRADGSAALKKSWWGKDKILPGDTIVVPLDVEKIRALKAWSEAASIFANLVTPTATAVTAAAAWKTVEAIEDPRTSIIINKTE